VLFYKKRLETNPFLVYLSIFKYSWELETPHIEASQFTDEKGFLTWEFQNADSRRQGGINVGPMTG
jgi:hypothetical protein